MIFCIKKHRMPRRPPCRKALCAAAIPLRGRCRGWASATAPAAQRTAEPLAPVRTEVFDPEQLKKEQQLLLDYARLAVTEENVALLARQALAARPQVNAALLADEYPNDFARIIGLHTYSQSPHRDYDIQLTGNWVERGGFRFEDFVLTRRREEENGNH